MSDKQSGRRSQRREEMAQKKRRQSMLAGGLVIVVIVTLAGLVIFRNASSSVEGAENFGTQDRGHDEDVVIETNGLPPVGGVHSPRWQNCGIYNQPVDNKNAVHSMEHGAVWLTYRSDLAADQVKVLQDLVRGQTYVIMSPFPELISPVVLTAWGIQLEVDSVSDERISDFVDAYRLGPQTPEFGAPCDGGVGFPIS